MIDACGETASTIVARPFALWRGANNIAVVFTKKLGQHLLHIFGEFDRSTRTVHIIIEVPDGLSMYKLLCSNPVECVIIHRNLRDEVHSFRPVVETAFMAVQFGQLLGLRCHDCLY